MQAVYLPAVFCETLFYNHRLVAHMMEQRYLPAILQTTLSDSWGMQPMNWMDARLRGTDAYYPYALLSAYHWFNVKFKFEPDAWIFGDSGGYSIATQGALIDPTDIIRWQIANCTAGCILDVPPYDVHTSLDRSRSGWAAANFDAALVTTATNTKRALDIYLAAREAGSPFRWWGLIQGQLPHQLETWWSTISNIYPFADEGEGWAIKPFPGDPRQLARCLRFLHQKEIKNAHVLRCTARKLVVTLYALGLQIGLKFVTFDSSSASLQAINRICLVPTADALSLTRIQERSRMGETFAFDYMREKCECASCTMMREDLDRNPAVDSSEYRKYRLVFHNHLVMVGMQQALWRECQSHPNEFLRECLADPDPEEEHGDQEEDRLKGMQLYDQVMQAFDGRLAHPVAIGTPKSILEFV